MDYTTRSQGGVYGSSDATVLKLARANLDALLVDEDAKNMLIKVDITDEVVKAQKPITGPLQDRHIVSPDHM